MIVKIKPEVKNIIVLASIDDNPEAEKVQLFKRHMIKNIQRQMCAVENTLLTIDNEATKAACRQRMGALWAKMNELQTMNDETFKARFNNHYIASYIRNRS